MNDSSGQTPRSSETRRPTKVVTADQARIVRRYLSAVESNRPGRGAKRTTDAIGNRITKIDEMLVSADPLTRVHLTQERIELHAEQVRLNNGNQSPLAQLERDFLRVVRSYSDRYGVTFAAWRQVGVDTKVLDRAGIHKAEKKPPPAAVRAAADRATETTGEERTATSTDEGGGTKPEPATDLPAAADVSAAMASMKPDAAGTDPVLLEDGAAPASEATPPDEPEVSLDELASLLTDVGSGAAAAASDEPSQPVLGEELSAAEAPAPRQAPRQPRPSAEE